MRRPLLFLVAVTLMAADPWSKVRELPSGTELRIYKTTSRQPIIASLDEVTDQNIVIATKAEQMAIPKDEIDRIDYRPGKAATRVTRESKTTTSNPSAGAPLDRAYSRSTGPQTSTSTSVSVGSKADLETAYRRIPPAPSSAFAGTWRGTGSNGALTFEFKNEAGGLRGTAETEEIINPKAEGKALTFQVKTPKEGSTTFQMELSGPGAARLTRPGRSDVPIVHLRKGN